MINIYDSSTTTLLHIDIIVIASPAQPIIVKTTRPTTLDNHHGPTESDEWRPAPDQRASTQVFQSHHSEPP